MTSKEAYNYLLGLLESGGDMRWSLVKESMNKFKELIDRQSNPTLSECIKEWEDRGWTVDELKQFPVIKIWKLNKEQRVVDNIYVFNKTLKSKLDFDADYETLNLLTKTLKALEVEDGK